MVTYRKSDQILDKNRLQALFSELTRREFTPDLDRINSLIQTGSLFCYVAEEDGEWVGMCYLVPCQTAMTDKLWIEDVVVHSSARGKGIGRGLLEFALEDGRKRFPDCVFYLTSRPSRVAARKLYTDLGFQEYETGVFKK